jgi:hypothetical protein
MDRTTGFRRIASARVLSLSEPLQLVMRTPGGLCMTNTFIQTCDRHPTPASGAAAPGTVLQAIVLQLGIAPTPANVERIRRRVEELNDELAASGVPFSLRLMGSRRS